MPNGTYGGVRGKETKVGQKTFVSRPTRFSCNLGGRTSTGNALIFCFEDCCAITLSYPVGNSGSACPAD